MKKVKYNPASARSILKHGETLLGHSLKELYDDATVFDGKGGLGESVEYFHYGHKLNSDAEPDFKEAGLELKCVPLKLLADNSMAAKERLVLNIINYIEEADKYFETSSFWHKNKFLLLMFYLHQSRVDPVDMLFKLVRTWKFPKEDLKIITDDWNIIHDKILSGRAHELTEGETFYLAPCMKGSKSGGEMRKQPYSDVLAQQRAYSLKQGYVNKIILASYLDEKIQHQLKLSPKRVESLVRKYSSEKVVKSTRSYKKNETFEKLIERRMKPFYGRTVAKIEKKFNVEFNVGSKNLAYNVCKTILGVKTKRIEEFENAGVTMKSVVLEAKSDRLIESMSFPYFKYTEIINQKWEESEWYKSLSSKFLFVIFRKSPDRDKKKMKLEKVFFWNMPYTDLNLAEELWLDTQAKVKNNDYDHFLTKKEHAVCHVRPHGIKGQTVPTPQGDRVQPKCFWLNNDYVLNIIKSKLK